MKHFLIFGSISGAHFGSISGPSVPMHETKRELPKGDAFLLAIPVSLFEIFSGSLLDPENDNGVCGNSMKILKECKEYEET